MKNDYKFTVECRFCNYILGQFLKKDIKGTFVCPKCNTVQQKVAAEIVSYSHKRNYPQGYFENQ